MTFPKPTIFRGEVMHQRLRPFGHELRYRVFYLLLDIDTLSQTCAATRCLSYNRFNAFGFYDRDHGARDGSPLRPWLDKYLMKYGFDACTLEHGGKAFLLTYPRMLGYVFNPLSIYFCYDKKGELQAVLHEVKNTFGEQHGYLLPVEGADARGLIQQQCAKGFHVSPFLPIRGHYEFTLREPLDKMLVLINQYMPDAMNNAPKDQPDTPETETHLTLIAKLTGQSVPLTDRELIRCFFAYPLMTLKTIAAIHVEAFHLWRKGARFFRKPKPPENEVKSRSSSFLNKT